MAVSDCCAKGIACTKSVRDCGFLNAGVHKTQVRHRHAKESAPEQVFHPLVLIVLWPQTAIVLEVLRLLRNLVTVNVLEVMPQSVSVLEVLHCPQNFVT